MSEILSMASIIPEELLGAQNLVLTQEYMDQVTADYIKAAKRSSALDYWTHVCPSEYQVFDFNHENSLKYASQINHIINWDYLSKKGLIASGKSNVGKTRSFWELIRRLAFNHSIKVECYSSAKWFNLLQENVRFGRDEAYGWVESVAKRPIVFIDDFGQQALMTNKADWAFGYFMQFLDMRSSNGLPLLITTNLTAEGLKSETTQLRSDPFLRRLLDVCDPIKF